MAGKDTEDMQEFMEKHSFYEHEPKVGDVVMVQVVKMQDNSTTVKLLEYQGREAMLPHTELTNLRMRSIIQTIHVGKIEPMEVLRVDANQGYVDVSKKKVKKEDAENCKTRYEQAKQVHRMLARTAKLANVPFEKLLAAVAFPAYSKSGHAINLLKNAANDPSVLDPYVAGFDPKTKDILLSQILHSLKLKEVVVQAKVNATCYSSAGVDGLREALIKTQNFGEAVEPKMKLLVHQTACPEYLLQVKTDDKVAGRKKLHDAIKLLGEELAAVGGEVSVKEEPTVIEGLKADNREKAEEDDE